MKNLSASMAAEFAAANIRVLAYVPDVYKRQVQLLVDYLFEGRAPDVSCYYLDAHIKNAFNC